MMPFVAKMSASITLALFTKTPEINTIVFHQNIKQRKGLDSIETYREGKETRLKII